MYISLPFLYLFVPPWILSSSRDPRSPLSLVARPFRDRFECSLQSSPLDRTHSPVLSVSLSCAFPGVSPLPLLRKSRIQGDGRTNLTEGRDVVYDSKSIGLQFNGVLAQRLPRRWTTRGKAGRRWRGVRLRGVLSVALAVCAWGAGPHATA